MPKKAKEVEENIEVTTPVKQETFATLWFKDNAVENPDVIKTICDLTARSAKEQFHLDLPRGNSEIYAMIFYATFMTVLDFIRSKEKTYNNFTIEIAKSINIGFTNNTDEDNQKVGNFMPIMEYIGVNRSIVNDASRKGDPIDKAFMDWKELNIKKTVDYYKELQDKTFNVLMREYKTNIRTPECVFPLFCIFLDMIVSVLKMKYREAEGTDVSEVQINVLGLFDAYYSYDVEEDQEIIEFQPNITMKLALKNDDTAARQKQMKGPHRALLFLHPFPDCHVRMEPIAPIVQQRCEFLGGSLPVRDGKFQIPKCCGDVVVELQMVVQKHATVDVRQLHEGRTATVFDRLPIGHMLTGQDKGQHRARKSEQPNLVIP